MITYSFDPSKYCKFNPSTLRRIIQSLSLKDYMQFVNPLREYIILRRIIRRVEEIYVILQPFLLEKLCNPSKDWRIILQPFHGLCNPSKGWRIMCNSSKGCRITFIILRRVEGLHVTLQPFEGLCNPWKGWRIAYNPSTFRLL